MKTKFLTLAAALMALQVSAGEYTRHVNPFIGTGNMEGGLSGNCYPGATTPFGMVQVCADTHPAPDWYNASGYNYNDSTIYGFTHTRLSGTGVSDLIDISLFPTVGDRTTSRFSHSSESASPGYYSVMLADEGIRAELSATPRTGIHRYTFPAGSTERRVWVDVDRSMAKGSWGCHIIQGQLRQVSPTVVEGYRVITGWAKMRRVYFSIEFSQPVEIVELRDGDRKITDGTTVINGSAPKGLFRVLGPGNDVVAKVGISPVSAAGARQNRMAEAPGNDFDTYAAAADSVWDSHLGRIEVKGDPERLTTFYTALYHTMIQPNLFSDSDGSFMLPDYSVAKVPSATLPDTGAERRYTTFSLWDTYRAAHPLYTILCPDVNRDFVNSMLDHYDAYGYLPIWHLWGQDNYCMIGNHAIPVVVDAVLKQTPGIDPERAFRAVKGSSVNSHTNSPFGVWEKYGYMPEDLQTQSVSITLEMAYDDWCVAQLAARLGHTEDYERFIRRSANYRNLFNPESGFFQARTSDGAWLPGFDPVEHGANGGNPFTEGNAWQYFWYVPQDVDALVGLTGGRKEFEKKLDTFFTLTEEREYKNQNVSGEIGQYAHGNEPSHHVALLYNWAGRHDKTTAMVHRIMTTLYDNTSAGYAGNDDCGEMSAWYVFNAMGFYPVNPASGEYSIGLPLFDECTVHLPSGKDFTITAKRKKDDSTRVRKITLDGKPLEGLTLRHSDILGGGRLHFNID